MSLVIDLKAHEKLIVGEAVIAAGDHRTKISIQGEAHILREKDVMTPQKADTACKKLYLIVQLMYMSREPEKFHDEYFKMVREIQKAAPTVTFFVLAISEKLLEGDVYRALKEAAKLLEHEKELLQANLTIPATIETQETATL